jgi:hypothetical protein
MNQITTTTTTGLTLTASLAIQGVVVETNIVMTETTTTGFYTGTMPAIVLGDYTVLVFSLGVIIESGIIYWDGEKEISPILYNEIHKIQGLNPLAPLTTTENSMHSGGIQINITGNGETLSVFKRS